MFKKRMVYGIILFLGFLILSYLIYLNSQEKQMFIANNLYSTWSVQLNDFIDFEQVFRNLDNNKRVFIEHDEHGHVRTVLHNGKWKPPLVSGEFFGINSNRNSAVVGNYHFNEDIDYINFNGTYFRIIGIIGAGYPSGLDRIILLNNFPQSYEIYNVIIDARSARDLTDIIDTFETNDLTIETSTEEFLNNFILNHAVRQSIIVIATILSISIGYIFFLATSYQRVALELIGYSQLKILFKNLIELLYVLLINFGLVFCFVFLSIQNIFFFNLYIYYLWLSLLILFSYFVTYLVALSLKFGGEIRD